MLYVPAAADFQKVLYGPAAARPATTMGVSVTPGNNVKGTYVQLISGASLTSDAYGILITFHSNSVATAARSTIVDIGYDPAGGTSYTVLIADLLASQAGSLMVDREQQRGISYYFPLFIKSGTSLAAAASVNNATVGTLRCQIKLFCLPKHPEALKVGSFVESLGVAAATSQGTAVTSGTTSEGAWTSLGTTVKKAWWAQAGFSINNGVVVNLGYFMDLSAGAAGGEQLLEDDTLITTNSTDDSVGKDVGWPLGGEVVGGATIWGRLQCSGTPDAGLTMMAYLLG